MFKSTTAVLVAALAALALAGCSTEGQAVPTAAAPAVSAPGDPVEGEPAPVEGDRGFGLAPGETYTFASGSTLKLEAEPFKYPKTLGGYPVTDKDVLNAKYVLLRTTYTNKTQDPRSMNALLSQVSTGSGNSWQWTLGVDVRYAGGPVQPGRTGVVEWVYRAPTVEPDATELYAPVYEPWPDNTSLMELYQQGVTPEQVDLFVDTAKLG